MKYKLSEFVSKIIASLMAVFTALFSVFTPKTEEPDSNIVTDFDVSAADYELTIDADNEIHDISELLFGIFF